MKKISKIIAAMGLILILGSVSLNLYTKYKESEAINNLKQKIEVKDDSDENKEIKIGDEIALIDIDSVDISSVIVNGIGKEQIRHYIGHFENTPMPGETGNFSIAGHSSTIYNNVFNNLKNIKVGDDIVITTIDAKFIYKVSEVFESEPSNMSVLDQDNEIKEMTIVTCTKDGKERLIVKAVLDEKA